MALHPVTETHQYIMADEGVSVSTASVQKRGQLSKQEVHVYAALLMRIVQEFLRGAEMERGREKERGRG